MSVFNAPWPRSEESERALFAAVLLTPSVWWDIAEQLRAEDFYFDRHRALYRAMESLAAERIEIDLRSLQAVLEDRGEFELVGGFAYLAGLDQDLPSLDSVPGAIQTVADRARRRALMGFGAELAKRASSASGRESSEWATSELWRVLGSASSEMTSWASAAEELVVALEERAKRDLLGLPTGFPTLDYILQGLVPGNLVVIAGRPSMGKSTLLWSIVRHAVLRAAHPAMVFSPEMTTLEISERVAASEAGIRHDTLRSGRMSSEQWRQLLAMIRRTRLAQLLIDDSPGPSVMDIHARVRRESLRSEVQLVAVDYINLMSGDGRSREEEVGKISKGLKEIAKELGIPVVCLAQLNRRNEHRGGPPMLADLRESGSIEQNADVVLAVHRERDDDGKPVEDGQILVLKHRNGMLGTVPIRFDAASVSFVETTEQWAA